MILGLRPQEAGAEEIPRSLLARTFPIPYAPLRNGALSERALATLARNDSEMGAVGIRSRHIISENAISNYGKDRTTVNYY